MSILCTESTVSVDDLDLVDRDMSDKRIYLAQMSSHIVSSGRSFYRPRSYDILFAILYTVTNPNLLDIIITISYYSLHPPPRGTLFPPFFFPTTKSCLCFKRQ